VRAICREPNHVFFLLILRAHFSRFTSRVL
jgi:hypothetical protein